MSFVSLIETLLFVFVSASYPTEIVKNYFTTKGASDKPCPLFFEFAKL